jgi:hypothetical protein
VSLPRASIAASFWKQLWLRVRRKNIVQEKRLPPELLEYLQWWKAQMEERRRREERRQQQAEHLRKVIEAVRMIWKDQLK